MELFFILVFIGSGVASFFSPGGVMGVVVLIAWVISGVYLAFRYGKNFSDFINTLW